MIRALVLGKLTNNPNERISSAGKPFAQVWLSVSMGAAGFFDCSVICFDRTAIARLMALKKGADVSMAGHLKMGSWWANGGDVKPNFDLIADEISSTTPPQPSLPGAADLGLQGVRK